MFLFVCLQGAKIRHLPQILTISLLRFNYDFLKGERLKVCVCVCFSFKHPFRLVLKKFYRLCLCWNLLLRVNRRLDGLALNLSSTWACTVSVKSLLKKLCTSSSPSLYTGTLYSPCTCKYYTRWLTWLHKQFTRLCLYRTSMTCSGAGLMAVITTATSGTSTVWVSGARTRRRPATARRQATTLTLTALYSCYKICCQGHLMLLYRSTSFVR